MISPIRWTRETAVHEPARNRLAPEGTDQQLRLAAADHPAGPFADSGTILVPDQPFSIDAHPYRHGDGHWYLFYCVDFLEESGEHRVGTGIVVDRLLDMRTLAGDPRVVVRPHQDWHVFRKGRSMYGGVDDWYTVVGPSRNCMTDNSTASTAAAPGNARTTASAMSWPAIRSDPTGFPKAGTRRC